MPKNKQELPSSDKIDKMVGKISDSIVIQTEPEQNKIEKKPLNQVSDNQNIPKSKQRKKIIIGIALFACLVALIIYFKNANSQKSSFDFIEGEILFNLTLNRKYSWIRQKIDNEDENSPTWKQRIFIQESNLNFNQSSPIFLYVSDLYPLKQYQRSPLIIEQCENKNGRLIALQMRYFGESLPFSTDSHTTQNLKYLTVDQIIKDIASLITRIKQKQLFGITKRNPWIINGSGVTGTLIAWFRAKYPELTIGAFASSPIKPTLFAFEINQRSFSNINSGGRQCRLIIQKMLSEFESDMYGQKQAQMIDKYGGGFVISAEQIIYMVEDRLRSIKRDWFVSLCHDDQNYIKQSLKMILLEDDRNIDPMLYSEEQLSDPKQWKEYQILRTYRSKWYMICNQIGLLQTGDPNKTYISKVINQTFFRNKCKSIFGVELWPKIAALNQKYDGKMQTVTNLFIVHGFYDIWLPYGLVPNNNTNNYLNIVKCSTCQTNPDYKTKQTLTQLDKVLQEQKSVLDKWLEQYRILKQ